MKNNLPVVSVGSGKAVSMEKDGFCEVAVGLENGARLPFCLPGETVVFEKVKYKKHSAYYLKEITKPSPERQTPECVHFTSCGGCVLQHATLAFYEEFKTALARNALLSRNLDPYVLLPIKTVPKGQRRRANLEAIKKGDKLFMGFHRLNSRQIVDMRECPVLTEPLRDGLPFSREALNAILEPFQKAKIFLLEMEGKVDVGLEVQGVDNLTEEKKAVLRDVGAKAGWHRLQFRHRKYFEVLRQTAEITADFGDLRVEVDPWAFLQASAMAEKWMREIVADALGAAGAIGRAVDLFAGRGTFTGTMAKFAAIDAFEGDGKAVAALLKAVNNLPIRAFARDLFTDPLLAKELNEYGAAVIDPPRAGAKAQCGHLAESSIPLIIYVSCNPETFADDARILENGGYRLEKAIPVDQFLWSAHLEIVGIFKKN